MTRIKWALAVGSLLAVLMVTVILDAQNPLPPVRLMRPYHMLIGTSVQNLGSTGVVRGVTLKAICPGETIYIGIDSAVTTTDGFPMTDNETLYLEVNNPNQIWAIATASSQRLVVFAHRR